MKFPALAHSTQRRCGLVVGSTADWPHDLPLDVRPRVLAWNFTRRGALDLYRALRRDLPFHPKPDQALRDMKALAERLLRQLMLLQIFGKSHFGIELTTLLLMI